MNRTFPDNVKFRKSADPCLQKTLYNVLLAYGHHNQGVGYCQVSPRESENDWHPADLQQGEFQVYIKYSLSVQFRNSLVITPAQAVTVTIAQL